MAFEIILSPEAIEDLRRFSAADRTNVVAAMETHLRHEPRRTSKTRIKRLRGLSQPEYRLRVGDVRVYYDVAATEVHILAVIAKHLTYDWLEQHGIPL